MVCEETLIVSGQLVWNDTWLINLLSTWYSRALSLVILYFLLTSVVYLKLKEPVGIWLLCDMPQLLFFQSASTNLLQNYGTTYR